MGLALKAQAQSRATISALVDLKHPRQATFVKQANIAHGPQQVNNGGAIGANPEQYAQARTHGENPALEQNKLLEEDHGQPSGRMDTRAAQKAERSYQAVETVATVHRAKKPRGRAVVSRNAWRGGHWLTLRQAVKELNKALREQRGGLG